MVDGISGKQDTLGVAVDTGVPLLPGLLSGWTEERGEGEREEGRSTRQDTLVPEPLCSVCTCITCFCLNTELTRLPIFHAHRSSSDSKEPGFHYPPHIDLFAQS